MKKSFAYLSSIIFASLLTVSSVDAGFFSKKDPSETVSRMVLGEVDTKSAIKETKNLGSLTAGVKKYLDTLSTKIDKATINGKSFTTEKDLEFISFFSMQVSCAAKYMLFVSEGIDLIKSGLTQIDGAKKEGDKKEVEGRKALEQGIRMLNISNVYIVLLKAHTVLLDKCGKNMKLKINNVGEIRKLLDDCKKAMNKDKKAIAPAADAFCNTVQSLKSNTPDESLQAMFEDLDGSLVVFKNIISIINTLLDSVDAYSKNNKSPLAKLAAEYDEEIRSGESSTPNKSQKKSSYDGDDEDDED